MRTALSPVLAALALAACSSTPQKSVETSEPPAQKRPSAPKPADETRRFPPAGRDSVTVVDSQILGKDFLPGGNLARYRKGPTKYELFLVLTAAPNDAAILLFDYKNKLESPKFIAHFGGYFGKDAGTETFLFAKGSWLAGIRGLPQDQADAIARDFAARLD